MRSIVKFLRDERAVTSVEYSVVLALILLTVFAAIGLVGLESGAMWSDIAASIPKGGAQ